MTRALLIVSVIAAAEAGYLLNDAIQWFSGVNYFNAVIEEGE